MQKRCCIGTVQPIYDVVTIPFNCSPSMISFTPSRGSYGCSSALIVLGWFDPPRMNEWKLGNALAGGTKERTRSDVLSTPATIMPMIVLSAVRIYQQVVARLCLALWSCGSHSLTFRAASGRRHEGVWYVRTSISVRTVRTSRHGHRVSRT